MSSPKESNNLKKRDLSLRPISLYIVYVVVDASTSQQDTSTLQTIIHSTVTSLLSEEKEKERRKLKLMIPESTSDDPLERKAHDIDQVNSVF